MLPLGWLHWAYAAYWRICHQLWCVTRYLKSYWGGHLTSGIGEKEHARQLDSSRNSPFQRQSKQIEVEWDFEVLVWVES